LGIGAQQLAQKHYSEMDTIWIFLYCLCNTNTYI